MKRIQYDFSATIDNSQKRFHIVDETMRDIISAGGLAIGEKALFFDPEIGWNYLDEGYLRWYKNALIIELG